MANTFFEPGAQRADKVRALFATIASRYDLINDVQSFGLHRRWKRRVVEMGCLRAGQNALDVCCGTGDLALALAKRGLKVTGLDFSQPMLEIARRRALRQFSGCSTGPQSRVLTPERTKMGQMAAYEIAQFSSLNPEGPQLRLIQADAQQLPFPDAEFDVVTVGYGLRNLADWERGLSEMQRVTRSGGRLLVLEFGKPQNPLWRALYYSYLRLFVPVLGLVFCGSASAYAYILESLRYYPGPEGVAAEMQALGLRNVRIVHLLGGIMSINYAEKH